MAKEEKLPKLPGKIKENTPEKVELSKEEQELRFNHAADGDCPELVKAKEEAKEEIAKDTEKELADRAKTVDKEVNNAETPKAQVYKDGKVTKKIKGMVEKLTLEEPSDVLNEGLEDYTATDKINMLLTDFDVNPNELLVHIENWLPSDELNDMINDFIIDNDLESEFEDIETEGLHVNPFREEVIDEQIPSDLMKAYRKNGYSGSTSNVDFHNANYIEISPDEATRQIKNGQGSHLRLIIDGKVVRINPDKHCGTTEDNGRVKYVDYDDKYVTGSGKSTTDTAHMPIKHLLKIASKIYLTNESSTTIDPNFRKQRSKNPESPNYVDRSDPNNIVRSYDANTFKDLHGNGIRGDNDYSERDIDRTRRFLDRTNDYIKSLQNEYDSGGIDKTYYDRRMASLQSDKASYEQQLADMAGGMKDANANRRYRTSYNSLRNRFNELKQAKRDCARAGEQLEEAKKALDDVMTNGSMYSRRVKAEYEEVNEEIRRLQGRKAYLELELEDIDEEDEKAISFAKKRVDDFTKAVNAAKAKIARIFNRK